MDVDPDSLAAITTREPSAMDQRPQSPSTEIAQSVHGDKLLRMVEGIPQRRLEVRIPSW